MFLKPNKLKIIILTITIILLGLNGYYFIFCPLMAGYHLQKMRAYNNNSYWAGVYYEYLQMIKYGTYITNDSPRYTEEIFTDIARAELTDIITMEDYKRITPQKKQALLMVFNQFTDNIAFRYPYRVRNYLILARQLQIYGSIFPDYSFQSNDISREILRQYAIFLAPRRQQVYNLLAIASLSMGDRVSALYYEEMAIQLNDEVEFFKDNKKFIWSKILNK